MDWIGSGQQKWTHVQLWAILWCKWIFLQWRQLKRNANTSITDAPCAVSGIQNTRVQSTLILNAHDHTYLG